MLRQMHATAVAARNHVEAFFCDCLLDAVRELLPDDVEPAGADLRATVIVRAVEAQEVPDVAPEEELVAVLSQLVEALKVCIASTQHTNCSMSVRLCSICSDRSVRVWLISLAKSNEPFSTQAVRPAFQYMVTVSARHSVPCARFVPPEHVCSCRSCTRSIHSFTVIIVSSMAVPCS